MGMRYSSRLSNYTVLITDDDFINRAVLKHMLKNMDGKIEIAENGKEAIAYINNNPNETIVLLLDIYMPIMDGFQVIEQIHRMGGQYKNVKIIAITALHKSDLIERNVYDKIFGMLRKPVDKNDLVESITTALIV